jgi:hypothetical protein
VEPRWERLKGRHAHGAEVAIDLLDALDDRRLVVHCAILAAEAARDKPRAGVRIAVMGKKERGRRLRRDGKPGLVPP